MESLPERFSLASLWHYRGKFLRGIRDSIQPCVRAAVIKLRTAGEKRRPDMKISDTSRATSGSPTGWVRTPGMVGEYSGRKHTPNPAATII
jgi:hypothetical protein